MPTPLQPDLQLALRFTMALDTAGIFTFQTFADDKKHKNQSLARVMHGSVEQHFDELVHLQSQGAGVFVMVNHGDGVIHPGSKTCRTAGNVMAVRSFFADLDGAPLAPVRAKLQPDIVVESSPDRWHCYWLTNDCPLDEFKSVQQRIAQQFGSDPKVCDLPRVMRLPGFYHQKAETFMTHMTYPE